jgi:Zn finger protein HypA/HybF involved in hydrogenase expression
MMTKIKRILRLALTTFILSSSSAYPQEDVEAPAYIFENQACLKCHGHKYFSYFNETVGRDIKERMSPYYVIDSDEFYQSNHRNFQCTDCHSYSYSESFPHPNELRFEPMMVCMDCHEGDEIYEKFNFATINEEYLHGVHSEKHSEEFNCWMCHSPHSYKITARNSENLLETIRYDNEICLNCHSDQSKIGLLSDRHIYDMLNQHEWLPNNRLHFQKVRCIECHALVSDTLMVAHMVQPKEKAVKLCVECHSQNSILMASLYKHIKQETQEKQGFLNAAILSQGYVIGANRNYFLNYGSLAIFAMVLLGIATHAILRSIYPKK